jgi:hypothetical protein
LISVYHEILSRYRVDKSYPEDREFILHSLKHFDFHIYKKNDLIFKENKEEEE